MLREMYLYAYVKKFLQREDKEMNDLMQEYQEFMPQITIQLKKETFSSCIQAIADELFDSRKTTYPFVMSLLAFSLMNIVNNMIGITLNFLFRFL